MLYARAQFFRDVHEISFAKKYVDTQTQFFVLFRMEIHEQITVWLLCRVFIRVDRKSPVRGIHLSE